MLKNYNLFIIILICLSFCLTSCSNDTSEKALEGEQVIHREASNDRSSSKSADQQSLPARIDERQLKDLEDYHEKNPVDYTAAHQLARQYEGLGDTDKALSIYNKYLTVPDENIANRARFDTLLLYMMQGRHQDAYDGLISLSEKVSDAVKVDIYYELGNLMYLEQFDFSDGKGFETALNFYKKALELNPSSMIIYKRIAEVSYKLGDINTAREYLAIFLLVHADDGASWLDLAEWSVESNDIEHARAYYERAKTEGPEEIKNQAERALKKLG